MQPKDIIHCSTHGPQSQCFVCQHLVQSLEDRLPRGVNWLWDPDGQVNAWCDDCEAKIVAGGGKWTGTTDVFAGITLICSKCFASLKDFNSINELN